MFTKAELKTDINGQYGLIEKYDVYYYGKNLRLRALLGVDIQSDGSFVVSQPKVRYNHAFVNMKDRDVTPEEYVKAKKPIYTSLTEKTLVVGVGTNSVRMTNKVVVYRPQSVGGHMLMLVEDAFKLPEDVENELLVALGLSDGERSKFLENRIKLSSEGVEAGETHDE